MHQLDIQRKRFAALAHIIAEGGIIGIDARLRFAAGGDETLEPFRHIEKAFLAVDCTEFRLVQRVVMRFVEVDEEVRIARLQRLVELLEIGADLLAGQSIGGEGGQG